MARRFKSQSGSPNKILVIFLVVFILTTMGLGVWGYTLTREREKWDNAAKTKDKDLKEAAQSLEWVKYQRDELLAAIGDEEFYKKAEAVKNWQETREFFMKGEKFKNEDGDLEFKAFVKSILEKGLGGYDDRYKTKFAELEGPLKKKLAKLQQDYVAQLEKNKLHEQELVKLQKKYMKDRDDIIGEIAAAGKAAVDARLKAAEKLTDAFKENEDLQKKYADREAEHEKALTAVRKELANAIVKGEKFADSIKNPNRSLGEPHALVLDISKGKPLWDISRGKILRVDDTGKKVFIDKGARDGIKPGLTFAVFAGSWNGRGEGEMKATIEVVRVEDDRTSLCKINTVYDHDGREVPVTDATPSRVLQGGANALKDGDLLFNLFWGTHVAIVGIVDFSGTGNKSPAAQMEDLNDFMRGLKRLGMVVDAYPDLRDGKMVGAPTPQTNFLIRGYNAPRPRGDTEDPRAKAINDSIAAMRDQAIERGMFVISPENVAIVSGLRRAGADGIQQTFNFVPGRPSGSPPREPLANAPLQKKDQ